MTAEPNKKTETSIETDALREDVQKLQNDLKELFHSVGEQSREKLHDTKQKLTTALKSLQGKVVEKSGEVYDSLRVHSEDAVKVSRQKIQERPITAVLIAFAAGIIVDRLIRRR